LLHQLNNDDTDSEIEADKKKSILDFLNQKIILKNQESIMNYYYNIEESCWSEWKYMKEKNKN
jgi:hypothetical protein